MKIINNTFPYSGNNTISSSYFTDMNKFQQCKLNHRSRKEYYIITITLSLDMFIAEVRQLSEKIKYYQY